jgi:hypothetical protein
MIAPSELRQAVLHLVTEHIGLGRDEAAPLVARALGFRATGANLRAAVHDVLGAMLAVNTLVMRDERLYLAATRDAGRERAAECPSMPTMKS